MKKGKIALPITIDDLSASVCAELEGMGLIAFGSTEKKARKELQDEVREAIKDYVARKYYGGNRQKVIITKDGAIFVVRYRGGAWEYHICSPNHDLSATVMSYDSMEDALEHARKHAQDCFGGIVSETTIV